MACSSNCLTGPHDTWGACVRAKALHIADVTAHKFNQGQHKVLKDYVSAREAGLQPAGTTRAAVDAAWQKTEETGTPYRADKE